MSNSYPGTYGLGALHNIVSDIHANLNVGTGWYSSYIDFNAKNSHQVYSGTKVIPDSQKCKFLMKY